MKKESTSRFDANFTAGGLLYSEINALEKVILSENFEELIELEVQENKYVGIATESSRKRILLEIKRRYKNAPKPFWEEYFGSWNEQEQKLALLYLSLKTYRLILDIQLEVALKKYKIGAKMNANDIQMRFEEIKSEDEKVDKWSQNTLDRLNHQYRKALIDSGLYNKEGFLTKPINIGSRFLEYFENANEQWFLQACFIK